MGQTAKVNSDERRAAADALGRDDLILSHMSMPGAAIETRVAAAAAAGFAAIGLSVGAWRKLERSGWTTGRLGELLDEHGVLLAELEFIQGWADAGGPSERAQQGEALAYDLADGVGARHLNIGGPYEGSVEDAARAFGELCDRAADHGLSVALEFLPSMTNIETAAAALAIAEGAGRDNGGICVDSWHHERGARDLAMLASLPAEAIASIQFDDGPATPTYDDYVLDTASSRVPPGEGEFDLVSFVRALDYTGADVPYGVEVMSTMLDTQTPEAVAATLFTSTRVVLDRARAG